MNGARLYIFTVPPNQIIIAIDSRMEGALAKVAAKHEKGTIINFVGYMEGLFIQSEIEKAGGVERIAEQVVEQKPDPVPEVKPTTTREQFIQNIQLVADDFVADEKDKRSLKRILGKVLNAEKEETAAPGV